MRTSHRYKFRHSLCGQRSDFPGSELTIPLLYPQSKGALVFSALQSVGDVSRGQNGHRVDRLVAGEVVVLALTGPNTRVRWEYGQCTVLAGGSSVRTVLHSNDIGCKHWLK